MRQFLHMTQEGAYVFSALGHSCNGLSVVFGQNQAVGMITLFLDLFYELENLLHGKGSAPVGSGEFIGRLFGDSHKLFERGVAHDPHRGAIRG